MHPVEHQDGASIFDIQSCPHSIRDTLSRIHAILLDRGIGREGIGTCEIVLAEVLNNIVEHAYGERPDGRIRLTLFFGEGCLRARIEDRGAAMPGSALPQGRQANLDVPLPDLPEGGFGWFMIHNLTEDLKYQRNGDVNRLDLSIRLCGH